MKDLLADQNRGILAEYACSRVLLAFDFDGTLAPIVELPDAAQMRESTRERLLSVARRYPCAVISGRSLADLQRRLEGLPLVAMVGNHGLEPDFATSDYARVVSTYVPVLRERLGHEAGVVVEDKRYSIAIHYRRSRAKREALITIRAITTELCGVFRLIGGKQVVNLVPLGAPHKGIAFERVRDESGSERAIYVGDDQTDEDVFALDQPERLLSVRIRLSKTTRARYYLQAQGEIDRLLDQLAALRPEARLG